MTAKTILFLIFVLLFLLGIHFAFFRSVIRFFEISRPGVRYVFYTAMILLSFSFVAAFWLLQWRITPWTIGFYKFAGTWMGYLFHFLSAAAAAWLLIGLAAVFRYQVNKSILASVLFLAAAAYASYGIWNAFQPRIRHISIPIDQVPPAWENKTIIHLSDIHLGHNHGVGFANRLVDRVNAANPDLILITGDLFDGMGGPFKDFIAPLNRLSAKKGVYFITGNHEHYIGIDRALELLSSLRLRVLDNERIEDEGLEIIGVSYPGIDSLDRIKGLPPEKNPEHARLLLFHTPTDIGAKYGDQMDRHFTTYWRPDTGFGMNRRLEADLQFSGHTHHGQIFPLNILTMLLYRGYDYGLSTAGNLKIYTTSGIGSWGPPMRTATDSEIVSIRLTQSPESLD